MSELLIPIDFDIHSIGDRGQETQTHTVETGAIQRRARVDPFEAQGVIAESILAAEHGTTVMKTIRQRQSAGAQQPDIEQKIQRPQIHRIIEIHRLGKHAPLRTAVSDRRAYAVAAGLRGSTRKTGQPDMDIDLTTLAAQREPPPLAGNI